MTDPIEEFGRAVEQLIIQFRAELRALAMQIVDDIIDIVDEWIRKEIATHRRLTVG